MAKLQRKPTSRLESDNFEAQSPDHDTGTPDGVTVTEVPTPDTLGEVVQLSQPAQEPTEVDQSEITDSDLIDETTISLDDSEITDESTDSIVEVENTPESAAENTVEVDEDEPEVPLDDPLPTLAELTAAGIYVPEQEQPVEITLPDAPAGKYAAREEKRKKAGTVCTPDWIFRESVFVIASHPPQRPNSVMGMIYKVIAEHKNGIRGEDLIRICRDPSQVSFAGIKSEYCRGGIPVPAWVEDNISGGSRMVKSHWKTRA